LLRYGPEGVKTVDPLAQGLVVSAVSPPETFSWQVVAPVVVQVKVMALGLPEVIVKGFPADPSPDRQVEHAALRVDVGTGVTVTTAVCCTDPTTLVPVMRKVDVVLREPVEIEEAGFVQGLQSVVEAVRLRMVIVVASDTTHARVALLPVVSEFGVAEKLTIAGGVLGM